MGYGTGLYRLNKNQSNSAMRSDRQCEMSLHTKRKYVVNSGVRQHINVAQRALTQAIDRVEENEISMEVMAIIFAMKYRLGKTVSDIVWSLKQMRDSRYWRNERQVRKIIEHVPRNIPSIVQEAPVVSSVQAVSTPVVADA